MIMQQHMNEFVVFGEQKPGFKRATLHIHHSGSSMVLQHLTEFVNCFTEAKKLLLGFVTLIVKAIGFNVSNSKYDRFWSEFLDLTLGDISVLCVSVFIETYTYLLEPMTMNAEGTFRNQSLAFPMI